VADEQSSKTSIEMNLDKITDSTVKKAMEALQRNFRALARLKMKEKQFSEISLIGHGELFNVFFIFPSRPILKYIN
jgi:hypothetical protein